MKHNLITLIYTIEKSRLIENYKDKQALDKPGTSNLNDGVEL